MNDATAPSSRRVRNQLGDFASTDTPLGAQFESRQFFAVDHVRIVWFGRFSHLVALRGVNGNGSTRLTMASPPMHRMENAVWANYVKT